MIGSTGTGKRCGNVNATKIVRELRTAVKTEKNAKVKSGGGFIFYSGGNGF